LKTETVSNKYAQRTIFASNMIENQAHVASVQTPPTNTTNSDSAGETRKPGSSTQGRAEGRTNAGDRFSRDNRNDQQRDAHITSVTKGYEGDTPELGGVLGLHTENVDKKVSFHVFCEKLGIYIMKNFDQGEDVFSITTSIDADPVADYKTDNKPEQMTDEEKNLTSKGK